MVKGNAMVKDNSKGMHIMPLMEVMPKWFKLMNKMNVNMIQVC